jgi:lipoprotein-releasing system ATP-binding protein
VRDIPKPAIRAEGLGKTYQGGSGELSVFSGLDLTVMPGERLALTGESGTGKSTLLHLLGCLDRPTKGRIFLGNQEVTALSDDDLAEVRNRDIGFVWQMESLLLEFSAVENVMMPLLIRGTSQPEARAIARDRLEEVGLGARAENRAGELSGGEQQRVVLARALAGKPKYLLADEPTGNLDERTGEKIMELIERIHEAHGLTTILVTHNVTFARRCGSILQLERGALTIQRPGV